MKLIFFDESKNDNAYHHYHIGAICVDEANLNAVEKRVAAVAEQAFGTAELSRATELHAAQIYHRNGHFKTWTDFEKRLSLINEVIGILCLEEVKLIDIQINCEKLHPNQSAAEVAFMFLCERASDLARSQGGLGMLIGDRESDLLADRFACALSSYRAKGTDFQFGRDLDALVDSVHFTHSHLSRFLQLADTYAWLLQFRNRHRGSENPRHRRVLDMLSEAGGGYFPSKYKEWPK